MRPVSAVAPLAPFADLRVDLRDGVVADASNAVVMPDVTFEVLCGRSAWLASNSSTSTPLLAEASSRARLSRSDFVFLVSFVEAFVFMVQGFCIRWANTLQRGTDRNQSPAYG